MQCKQSLSDLASCARYLRAYAAYYDFVKTIKHVAME